MAWRIGIDTGGTFTDVIACDEASGQWLERKVWTVKATPGKSIRAALDALGIPLEDIATVVYGTTAVTNALVENKLARVAFVATAGFGDVLEIARQRRNVVFDLKARHRPPPQVPHGDCFEIDERTLASGEVETGVRTEDVAALAARVSPYDAVAVSLLHSYANPANEQRVAEVLSRECRFVSVSHDVSPEAREYERGASTALNAALLPMMASFVDSLAQAGIREGHLHLFHSAGGMLSPRAAARFPLMLAMSGPAAGVEAAAEVCKRMHIERAVTMDMGGTTTDCSLVLDGRPQLQMSGSIGAHPIRQPMMAVDSIGAGGGSIIRLTANGLQVGPDSAGASPGPACYGRGGVEPTLTDAFAVLGYFGTGAGTHRPIEIDVRRARDAFAPIAQALGIDVEAAALGALKVANAVAARSLKRITMGQGVDLRTCELVAYGGTGPMLAAHFAQDVGIAKVVVPARSSSLSAFGCISSRPSFTRQRTVAGGVEQTDRGKIERLLDELAETVTSELASDDARVRYSALMRYAGQSSEIEVPIDRPVELERMGDDFHRRHEALYGFSADEPWDCVALRATALGERRELSHETVPIAETAPRPVAHARMYMQGLGLCDALEFHRGDLGSVRIDGPALITDEVSTIVVPQGWSAVKASGEHIILERHDK
ncbi:MAG TPA: hydantoinase/oxoprolinase family protein [Ramlibacter sp.]|uniref:hydantoinase/oxoprolinase family protein n=1 Tax=Ramlibacter sp. TaxID=1917967 RepID=UPI002B963F12|nr:hydantoinase/oxoprolinase family protein [Ramlibacter sp.]HVZ46347.1 hydantoinase/oxoprolinase family protein [Ramlibacter sp.]